jgi:hypothetical protein
LPGKDRRVSMDVSELRGSIVLILKHRGTILGSFLLVNFIGLLAFVLDGKSTRHPFLPYHEQVAFRGAVFVMYSMIAFLSYRGSRFFTLVMCFFVGVTGILGLSLGVLGVTWYQYFLKLYFIALGVYFIYGSVVLFKSRRGVPKPVG